MSDQRWFEEPPEVEPERPESHFRADVALARQPLDQPAAERDAFLNSDVGERLRMRLELSGLRARRRRRMRVVGAMALSVAVVLLGISLWPRTIDNSHRGVTVVPFVRGVGIKGGSSLQIHRKRGGDSAPIGDGAVLRGGDRIRFVYRTDRRYLIIVNVEAAGVAPFYPYPAGASLATETGPRQRLPGSIALDVSAGTERIVAVFSDEPLSFAAVRAAIDAAYPKGGAGRDLRERRPLGLPGDIVSVRIEKRSGRGQP